MRGVLSNRYAKRRTARQTMRFACKHLKRRVFRMPSLCRRIRRAYGALESARSQGDKAPNCVSLRAPPS